MKKIFAVIGSFLLLLLGYSNCSQNTFVPIGSESTLLSSAATNPYSTPLAVIGNEANVAAVTVGCGYVNEPCVSVTICTPGTSTCQTIPNVLLDTGSYGLRLFSSAVSTSLTQLTDSSGNSLAECVSYVDGTSQWGPVQAADVIIGQEKASNVPIEIINSGFATPPSDCTQLDSAGSGYNGILGVGLFTSDCGSYCTTVANNRLYFSCSGSSCTSVTVATAQQVSNPVSYLPVDNNGVILQLPNVADAGAVSLSGYLILGIGTETNNTPVAGTHFFQADTNGNFLTTFNGTSMTAFIDSGSNGLFFPETSSLPDCSSSGNSAGFFCPGNEVGLAGTQVSSNSTTAANITFNIADADGLLAASNPNMVFSNLGGDMSGGFDWGLPFFLGRTVFVGTDAKTSSLGTGPYWAY